MNIYEKLNKINDAESLSEKYNVKNVKELKKLQESCKSRKLLKEDYKMDPKIWTEIKAYVEDPDITGSDLCYDGPYTDEIDTAYSYAIDTYNENNNDNVQYQASIQAGRGASELFSEDGRYASRNFETECDEILEMVQESDSFEEFMQSLVSYIHDFVDYMEVRDDEDEYDEDDDEDFEESLKEDTHSKYSNRVEGNKRYFDTMGDKIRYCLLDVIRCKGYYALYRYMQSLDPVAFSAYAPDFTTKLGELYQDDSVDVNRADTFGKIADDLQQQFIKMVSKVDSRKRSVYEDKTPEELWNNSPVEIDGKHYAKVQNFKKKFGID